MSDTPNPPPPPPPEPSPPPQVPYVQPGIPMPPVQSDIEKNKVMAMLAYLGILWLIPLIAARESPFARFHCNQGILLSIVSFCAWGVVVVGGMIPFVNFCAVCVVMPLFLVLLLALIIVGMLNAWFGRMKPLPFFPRIDWVK